MRLPVLGALCALAAPHALAAGTPGIPTWDLVPGSTGIGGTVYALAVFNDGSGPALYAGGLFASAGGQPASNLARWNGQSWTPVGGGTNGAVFSLCAFDDGAGGGPALYIGGNFTSVEGKPAKYLARWTGSAIEPVGGGVSVIGAPTAFSPAVAAMCVWDEDGAGPLTPALIVGGSFTMAGETPAGALARWRDHTWEEIGGGLRHATNALAVHDDGSGPALYAGGTVLMLGNSGGSGGLSAGYIGRYGPGGWSTLLGGLDAQALSFAALPNDTRLFMTGNFGRATSGPNMRAVGNWNGAQWNAMANGLPIIGRCVRVFDLGFGAGRQVFAGGHFAMHVWTGAAWQAMPAGMTGAPWHVHAMCVFDDGRGFGPELFVGGQFGGVGANIAAIRGGPPCPGDADGDRRVAFADLNAVLADFGRTSTMPGSLGGDLNSDGVVTFADLNIVLSNFGLLC